MLILESGQTFQNIPFSVLTATMTFPVLDLLCVLSALTATGHALSCKVCMASFSLYCDGPSVDCPDGHACISSYTPTTLEGSVLSKEFARSCSPRNMCNSPGSVSIPRDGKIKRSTSCCYTDDCLPPTPTLPEDNFKPNGLICSTCVSPDTVYCYTSDTMRCTGDENMCILESTRQYAPIETQTAIRGCATQSICNIGRQELSFGLTNMTIDMRCTSASSPLHSRLVLPFTVAVATVLTLVLSC